MNTTRAFNTYGHLADIAGVDHYVMYAPDNIPNSGVTRIPRLEEALDFAESLKLGSEVFFELNHLTFQSFTRAAFQLLEPVPYSLFV